MERTQSGNSGLGYRQASFLVENELRHGKLRGIETATT
jgi:hypothetical protein